MQAVIKSGGKQYKVAPGDVIRVEKCDKEPGTVIEFDQVLFVSDGNSATIGKPLVSNAQVVGTVVEEARARKVIVFKFKRKKQYKVLRGHRQPFTAVQINEIKVN